MSIGRGAAKKSRGPAVVFSPTGLHAALRPWEHSRPPNPLLQCMASAQTWPRRSIDIIDDVAGAGARSCEAHTSRLAMIVVVSRPSTRGAAMRCRRTWCKPKLQYLTVDKSRPSDASRRAWSKSRSQHCALNFVRLNHLVPSAEARAACRRIVAGSSQPCLVITCYLAGTRWMLSHALWLCSGSCS